jgi:lipopolysaccharide export system permease protein
MKILDKYLLKEVFPVILIVIFLFLIMMIGNDLLFIYADLIITRKVPFLLTTKLLLLRLPAFLVLALPVSILFGILLSLGRLTKDNEITAMRIGRISFYRLILPFLVFGSLMSILAYLTNEKIVPWTNHYSENIVRRLILTQPFPFIKENIFFKGGEDKYFYIKKYDKENSYLEGIMVYEITTEKYPRMIIAKQAYWKKNMWILKDGVIHNYDKDGHLQYEVSFKELKINIEINPVEFFGEQRTPQEMSAKELLKQIEIFKKGGIDTSSISVDLHFKFSLPFACFIVVLIGAPLSIKTGRAGSFLGIIFSILLTFFYYVIMSVSRSLGFQGILPPVLAAWLANLIFAVFGIYLIWKVEH